MNSKKLLYIGVTAVLVLSVLAIFTAGASAEDYTFVTKWGSYGTGDGEFNDPKCIEVDSSGYVFVADSSNHRIQKFDSVGNFITKWGSKGSGDGEFRWPAGITVASSGYVFVVDGSNYRIQKFDSVGNFITKWGSYGLGDGEFRWPEGITVASSGYVFVADTYNHRIQKFDSVGNFITKWGSSGTGDGEFDDPWGIAVDSSGYVFVADSSNHRIQKFDSVGNFITKWGSYGTGEGEFVSPRGIAVDSSGYVYVADTYNNRIQKFDSVGNFITKWGSYGTGDGEFDHPMGIAVDSSGYVFVADSGNERIQKFAPGIPEDPSLAFSPSSHDFSDMHEGDTDSTTFAIRNSGTGTLSYSLSESCGWVEVNPTSGSSTGEHDTITVDIDTTGLSEGSHTCDISVSSNDGSGTFTVTVNVVPCPETVVSIEDASAPPGGTVTVPINITGVANMCGANIWLNYNKNVVIVDSVSDGALVPLTHNIDNPAGVTKMNWNTTSGMTGDFVFAYVTLEAVGNPGDTCLLDLDVKELYDCVPPFNEIPRTVTDGMFTVTVVDMVPPCTAKYAVYQAGVPDPEGILNPLRELRDDYLKEEYVDRYYDYCPELTMVVTRDPALAYEAARLLVKYSPMVKQEVYGIGMDKLITRGDVQEIVSVTNRLKRGVWKNRDEIGVERSLEIIKFLDEFKGQIRASKGKTFSEAHPGSIYCEDEQMPDPDG